MKSLIYVCAKLIVFAATVIPASATAAREGGGGHVVIDPAGNVSWYDNYTGTTKLLAPSYPEPGVVKTVHQTLEALKRYGVRDTGTLTKNFNRRGYYFVDRLPEGQPACAQAPEVNANIPAGSLTAIGACTFEKKTFFLNSYYSKLNLEDKVGAYIHEAVRADTEDRIISEAYELGGISILFARIFLEEQKKNYRHLSDLELTQLRNFFYLVHEPVSETFIDRARVDIHPYGGGLICSNLGGDATLDDLYVNPASYFCHEKTNPTSVMHSFIFNSRVIVDAVEMNSSRIEDSVLTVSSLVMKEGALLKKAVMNLGRNDSLIMSEKSLLENSRSSKFEKYDFAKMSIYLGKSAHVKGDLFYYTINRLNFPDDVVVDAGTRIYYGIETILNQLDSEDSSYQVIGKHWRSKELCKEFSGLRDIRKLGKPSIDLTVSQPLDLYRMVCK